MMTALEFIGSDLKRMHAMLNNAIADLSPEQLHTVPGGHPRANTIAWGLWHYARTEGNVVRFVLQDRRPTVWQEGGYADKLGLPPVAQGTGMSHQFRRRSLRGAPLACGGPRGAKDCTEPNN